MIKTKILPSEYQEVEYIEGTGTQYIKTGYIPTQDTEISIKMSPVSNGTYAEYPVIFSVQNESGGTGGQFSLYLESNLTINARTGTLGNNILSNWRSVTPGNIYKLNLSFNKLVINGTTYTNTNNNWVTITEHTLNIFTRSNFIIPEGPDQGIDMASKGLSSYKLYRFQIFEDGELVKNLIPCYRKEDNEIGMYDLVNDIFYTNQGANTFIKGNDVAPVLVKKIMTKVSNSMKEVKHITSKYNNTMKYIYNSFPSEYQKVEYLQCGGSQYIDTGVLGSGSLKINLDFEMLTGNTANTWVCLMGARIYHRDAVQGDNEFLCFYLRNNGSSNADFNLNYDTEASNYVQTNIVSIGSKHKILFDKGQVYIDDVLSSVSQNEIEFTTASTNNHANLALFTNYEWTDNNYPSPHGETQNRNQKFRIYACKIYDENGVKIREFIPCYRKSDSVIGMYDTINQTFYTNAGTGAFTKGSDI